MDMFRSMNIFAHVVDGGSLIAAAESLDTSAAAVTRSLRDLEKRLGVHLLNRTTRRIALTEEGKIYLERCRQILSDVDDAERALANLQTTPKGHLVVTAPAFFGERHLAPEVTRFIHQFPDVSVNMVLTDRNIDLLEEKIDVAVRIGELDDSSLVAVGAGAVRRIVCASPGYLAQAGIPGHPRDVAEHVCVRYSGLGSGMGWQFYDGNNTIRVEAKGQFSCNQVSATIEACVNGCGLGMFLSYQVQSLVDAGALKIVLEDFEPPPLPVHVIVPQSRLLATRVKVFKDWMVQSLRKSLA